MRNWVRPWPWVLASMGLFLTLHYAYPLVFLKPMPEEDPPREAATTRPEMAAEEKAILTLARGERFQEALDRRIYGPPEAECIAGIAGGGVLLAVAAGAFWRRRTRFVPEGERLRAAAWVTGISALAILMALSPGDRGRPWAEACLWAGLLGLPLTLFCWYRAAELPFRRRALRDS